MDRTRRLSEEILQRHPEAFGNDFEENKKSLEVLAVIPSKQLRNRIAGYITKKKEAESEEAEGPAVEEPPV
ncbi:MAG: 30S ribosomal protein S17e [Nitrososphaerota archaeon]|nr:30S ribosomal protein S17e [Nitrososphaerota archaeon]MDG7025584.1 30S ribosomal protein S17e [Nitrososphaerota archaeon]